MNGHISNGYQNVASPPPSPPAPPPQAFPWHIPTPGVASPSTTPHASPSTTPHASPQRLPSQHVSPPQLQSPQRSSPQHQPPQLLFYDSQVLRNFIRPMVALGISNPNQIEINLQADAHGVRHGQNDPQIVEENVSIRVSQEGEENGRSVQTSKEFGIRVRRDIW